MQIFVHLLEFSTENGRWTLLWPFFLVVGGSFSRWGKAEGVTWMKGE